MKKKFEALETYRAFAALMICAIHFNLNTPLVNHFLASGIFVPFFFTLSGYVIYYNYHKKINNFTQLKEFSIKRFFRLYPLHLFFLIVFLIIEVARYIIGIKFGIFSNIEPFEKNNFFAFLCNIILLQTFLDVNTFNTPSWSISAEFYTYIFFATLMIYRFKHMYIILIILILFFRLNNDNSLGPSTTFLSFVDCIYCFLIGVLFCKIYFRYNKKKFFNNLTPIFSILFMIISILSIKFLKDNLTFFIPFIFGLLILFSSNLDKRSLIGKFICNNFFVYLGKISYSIYLSHLFVFWSVTQALRFIFKVDTYTEMQTGDIRLNLDVYSSSIIVIICYILTILISVMSYRFIEIKFYKKS